MTALLLIRIFLTIIISTSILYAKREYVWDRAEETKNPICNATECTNIAKLFFDAMNETIDPCKNFYEYACGKWKTLHAIPRGKNHITVLHEINTKMYEKLKDLLEESKSSEVDVLRAKEVYEACMSRNFYQKSEFAAVRHIMMTVGNWPIFMQNKLTEVEWWEIDEKYMKITGESSFFDIHIKPDRHSNYEPILQLDYPESLHGMIKRFKPWNNVENDYYIRFLIRLIARVGPYDIAITKTDMIREIKAVLNLRKKIEEIIDEDKLLSPTINRLKIHALQKWYDDKVPEKPKKIDWLKRIRSLYNADFATRIGEDALIYVPHITYLAKLGSLLATVPIEVIANHMHIYFAERALNINEELNDLLSKSIAFEIESPSGALRYEAPRWKRCIKYHYMTKTLGKMYINSNAFSSETKSAVEKMFEKLQDVVMIQILDSTWMDKDTKEKLKRRIQSMQTWIGYPPWQDDINLMQHALFHPDISVLDVNAFYLRQLNIVYVSAAYLKPPVYEINWPYALYYGSTFSMLGHEIYHAFTDNVWSKSEVNFATINLSPKMLNEMKKRKKCFAALYKTHTTSKIYKDYISTYFSPLKTQDEDIADCMGLKDAYIAFKMDLYKSEGNCPILPGFDKIWHTRKCEKLFFLAYANAFCANAHKEANTWERWNKHNKPALRVNIPIANMEEFNYAFECASESSSKHNKKQKQCEIW